MTSGHIRVKLWSLKKKLSYEELADIILRFASKIDHNLRVSFQGDSKYIERILTKDGRRILTPQDVYKMMDDLYKASQDILGYNELKEFLSKNMKSFKEVYENLPESPQKFEILARFLFIALLILATDFSRKPSLGLSFIFKEIRDLREKIKNYRILVLNYRAVF